MSFEQWVLAPVIAQPPGGTVSRLVRRQQRGIRKKLQFKKGAWCLLLCFCLWTLSASAQTAFLDFNTTGQYTNNFNPWEDNLAQGNGGVYAFEENPTAGVGGSGGVSVFQNTDTTATYKTKNWNFSTNGATMIISVRVKANGQVSNNKVQLGALNSNANGLLDNSVIVYESFRFQPVSNTVWSVRERYRTGISNSETILGNVNIVVGHWYKFEVALTNTSARASGRYSSGCALYDYGMDGMTPGTNIITFSTALNRTAQDIAIMPTVWPALRAFQNAGIDAWDNFLVYQTNSAPIFTLPLTNTIVGSGQPANFQALAEGPRVIAYSWYTNGTLVTGATNRSLNIPSVDGSYSTVQAVANNGNGATTNSAALTVLTSLTLTNTPATGIQADSATLNGQVNVEGEDIPTVTLFYGPTDGGTNAGSWAQAIPLGLQNGSYSQPVSSLTSNATYYYTAAASNSAGVIWASPSQSFTTLASNIYPAVVTNFTASGVWTDRAILNGQVFSTGGDTPSVTFYYGATNAGTNVTAWAQSLPLGLQSGAFTQPISGLSSNTTYYFTIAASNYAGVAWSPSRTFTTLAASIYPAVITNSPATAVQATTAALGGQVLNTGGDTPGVTLYYGTTDGGTNTVAWDKSVALGLQASTFGTSVSGLSSNTTYYFTTAASNYVGTSWASSSQTFTTLPTNIYPPVVTNVPAANILASTVTLGGQVLNTGGDTPQVTLYYGPADGGQTPAAWAQSLPLGLQSGSFTQSISGLSSNSTYYFTTSASNYAGTTWAGPSLVFSTLASNPPPPVAMLTCHNDNSRCGANTNELYLTVANVNTNSFGKLFSYPVDGGIHAQPLVMTNVNIPGKGVHNVLYIATEHDSVYAFDADIYVAAPYWVSSFVNPTAGITTVPSADVVTGEIEPEIGITSTPVIDPVSGTIYVEAMTKEVTGAITNYVQRLHALDLTTGAERSNSPVVITATNYPGTGDPGYSDNDGHGHVLFNAKRAKNRPALMLLNGTVYVAFGSHGDVRPYHGWLFAYDAHTLVQTGVFNSTPNGMLGGFWETGGGPCADAAGNFYLVSGNGDFNATGLNFGGTNNYGQSVLKFSVGTNLTVQDYFTPYNYTDLNYYDYDLGSGGAIVLPDSAGSAAHPHLMVISGKEGTVYLLDRDNLGHCNMVNDAQIVQSFHPFFAGCYDTPAFFNNTLYYNSVYEPVRAYSVANAQIQQNQLSQSLDIYAGIGTATPSISANGTNNGVVWAVDAEAAPSGGPAILRAYNAANLAQKLFSSDQLPARDGLPTAVKFVAPTIVNGHVYVGAQYAVTVYGNNFFFVSAPSITPNGGIFTNAVTVTIQEATPDAAVYYTLDGTTPTTNSTLYSAPFVLTNTAQVQAQAFLPGAPASGISIASFANSAAGGNGTGLLGAYYDTLVPGLSAVPVLMRTDPTINFDWTAQLPIPFVDSDGFSVFWTGAVQPQYSERYTFYSSANSNVRLWVNGQLLIDTISDSAIASSSGNINLMAQQRYNLTLEYDQDAGGGGIQLFWSSPSTLQAIVPQSQLYPVSNPPPAIVLTAPVNGSAFTTGGEITLMANAAAQYNSLSNVSFYADNSFLGNVANAPYAVTLAGLGVGNHVLNAVATDGSGLVTTSAPVNITVSTGSGLPYGLTNRPLVAPFLNLPTSINGSLPATLSQTGVFTNTVTLATANGLIPYNVIEPLWSDGAAKARWMALPNNGAPYTPDEQIGFAATGEWTFPSGTIFVKHFELATDETNTNAPRRRLETRLLVRDPYGAVYGVTYKWRADNSDADLLSTSLSEDIVITNAGGTRTQTWYYPSQQDCLRCHNPAANYVLGVKTRQLNSNLAYPGGQTDNQLRTMNQLGMLYPAIPEGGISNYTHLAALEDQSATLEDRTRSYLDVNCSFCHRPGGSGPTFDGRWDTPLTNQNIINGVLVKGDLGFDNSHVVTPKDIWRSNLYQRMGSTNTQVKMPPLARNMVDSNALAVVTAWINSLPGTPALPPPAVSPGSGSFQSTVTVTLSPPDTNSVLYYTLDGSLPTTNSLLYAGPFALTNTTTLKASAFETGYINSVSAGGLFDIVPSGLHFFDQKFLGGGSFQLSLSGQTGTGYVLQVSTDLTNWVSISTNVPSSSLFYLTDPNATNSAHRFYRVLQP